MAGTTSGVFRVNEIVIEPSAEGLLRMCRRPRRANLIRLQGAFASK